MKHRHIKQQHSQIMFPLEVFFGPTTQFQEVREAYRKKMFEEEQKAGEQWMLKEHPMGSYRNRQELKGSPPK